MAGAALRPNRQRSGGGAAASLTHDTCALTTCTDVRSAVCGPRLHVCAGPFRPCRRLTTCTHVLRRRHVPDDGTRTIAGLHRPPKRVRRDRRRVSDGSGGAAADPAKMRHI